MSKVDLVSRQWCELVFEGRNKEYGAYRLRSKAGARNLKSLITLFVIFAIIVAVFLAKVAVSNLMKENNHEEDQVTAFAELEQKKEEKKEEVKVEYVKPEEKVVKVKASIQFTVPKIEDDDKVVQEKEMKTQDDIQSLKNISIAAQTYEGDGEGGINIDDLKEDQKAGGTEAPKEEEVVDNAIVEVQATYPGGEAAILQHIAKNLQYPALALEQELQGVVVVRFEVKKDGSIGRTQVAKSLSKECDLAACNVVKTLQRFTPARQQGHPVAVWFTLPIRFQIQ